MCDAVMGRTNHFASEPQLRPRVELICTGYDDPKPVADFLDEIDSYSKADGASEAHVLARVLPLAFRGSAGWRHNNSPVTFHMGRVCNALPKGIFAPWVRATSPA
ncbi:hypothetical protein HPB50_021575 [Hyalomma asiaticum]|uniref:Uncharacterized protein n=1 Tax=Hyalomma asiaticum TaxID=266040 RepID=A0ACB7T0Y3_HYAAI|nr:hypothetical protein HPB50_021575 [Hyalomma asiaticum]